MKFGVDKIEYENDKIIVTGTTEIGNLKACGNIGNNLL